VKVAVVGTGLIGTSIALALRGHGSTVWLTDSDPAAARLWEEYLYSTQGQNLWLQGFARPIELSTLVADGTVNQTAYKALPPTPSGSVIFPTQSQQATAENVVAQQWSSVIG